MASKEAVEGRFAALGWERNRTRLGAEFYVLATYGIMEDTEMEISLEGEEMGVQMYIPQVRKDLLPQAEALLAEFRTLHTPLAILTVEDGYLLGAACPYDETLSQFGAVWAAYSDPDVYSIVLTLCGLTDVPPQDGYEMPDDPFEESI
ncbi:MAG: hypothetical protein J5755_00925 [Clostridia bacterium]|nr:hypothetical protein [Clostridia bacterium]